MCYNVYEVDRLTSIVGKYPDKTIDEGLDGMTLEDLQKLVNASREAKARAMRKGGIFLFQKAYYFCRLSIEATGSASRPKGLRTPIARGKTR